MSLIQGKQKKKIVVIAKADGTTRSIIMVFKVSFVININLFTRVWEVSRQQTKWARF